MSKQPPGADLGILQGMADDQRADERALMKLIDKHQARIAELDPKRYAPEHVAEQRQALQATVEESMRPVLRRMEQRAEEARQLLDRWQPAARRLAAAMADPVAADALARRLSVAVTDELATLAADAVTRNDWPLADAVATTYARRLDGASDGVKQDLAERVAKPLERMGGDGLADATRFARAVGVTYATCRVAFGEAEGRPLRPEERVTLAHQFPGPGTTEPIPQEA